MCWMNVKMLFDNTTYHELTPVRVSTVKPSSFCPHWDVMCFRHYSNILQPVHSRRLQLVLTYDTLQILTTYLLTYHRSHYSVNEIFTSLMRSATMQTGHLARQVLYHTHAQWYIGLIHVLPADFTANCNATSAIIILLTEHLNFYDDDDDDDTVASADIPGCCSRRPSVPRRMTKADTVTHRNKNIHLHQWQSDKDFITCRTNTSPWWRLL